MKTIEQKAKKVPAIRFAGFEDEWVEKKILDLLIQTITDGPHETPDLVEDGIPFISVDAIVDNKIDFSRKRGFITEEYDFECCKKYKPELYDVYLVKSGSTVGKTAIVETTDRFNIWSPLAAMRCGDKTNPYFLYFLLQTKNLQNQVFDKASHGTQPNLSMRELEKFLAIVAQRTDEQNQIGSLLKKMEHLVYLEQKKYDKLTQVKKSMLKKMFPKEGATVPEIRFAVFTGNWEEKKLSEIAVMHARIGWQNLRTSEFLDSGEYMLITGTDFQDGVINFKTCHYVEKERYDQDKHIQIKNGSILITKDGTLGKVAFVDGLKKPATLNAGVFNVENQDDVDGRYLFQYLKAPFLMDYVSLKATGGTIKHLNQNILVDFPVKLPSKSEQQKIGSYFSHLDSLISLQQRKLEKLKNIKKSLLEKMFV